MTHSFDNDKCLFCGCISIKGRYYRTGGQLIHSSNDSEVIPCSEVTNDDLDQNLWDKFLVKYDYPNNKPGTNFNSKFR